MPNNIVFNNVANQLHTQIFGSNGNCVFPIKTDSNGRLEVVGTFTAVGTITAITTEKIVELKADIINVGNPGSILPVETLSLSAYSFFVLNKSTSSFKVKLQISPSDVDTYYIDDISGEFTISTGSSSKAVLIPRHYLKYTRLWFEPILGRINAEVWFNGRG